MPNKTGGVGDYFRNLVQGARPAGSSNINARKVLGQQPQYPGSSAPPPGLKSGTVGGPSSALPATPGVPQVPQPGGYGALLGTAFNPATGAGGPPPVAPSIPGGPAYQGQPQVPQAAQPYPQAFPQAPAQYPQAPQAQAPPQVAGPPPGSAVPGQAAPSPQPQFNRDAFRAMVQELVGNRMQR